MKRKKFLVCLNLCLTVWCLALTAAAQKVPAPADALGFTPGDDKKLASWAQTVDYFQKLDAASDRVKFEEIGKSTMGNPFVYATISAPENLKNLKKYQAINKKLADPRLIKSNDKAARDLIKQGKTIVLITCGIHSTEVGSYLSSMLIAHKLATSNEPEIQKILQNTIVLLVPSLNPDGVDIVKNWYDKTLGTPYEGTNPPELYHKYTGHDNNRDWYAFTQVETQLTVDRIHNEWHPQIVNDIHQMGASGARLFVPPYMKPVEPNVPTQIVEGYTELGLYITDEMTKKGFAGITNNSIFDAWTPARAYSHYHGGVRILTETASARLASPAKIEFEKLRAGEDDNYNPQKASANFPKPWAGGDWTLRDITNYMTTSSFTLLKHASENRERWLSRFYAIGKEAVRPRKDGELFAYVLPFPQYDESGNASEEHYRRRELIEILNRGGVETKDANSFRIDGVKYPDSTVVIPLAQPYGNFAKALLEKQNYPNLRDEKQAPIQPYDVTAQTLSLLMNVEVKPFYKRFVYKTQTEGTGFGRGCGGPDYASTEAAEKARKFPHNVIYQSQIPSMDEGWTRWVSEKWNETHCNENFQTITDKEIIASRFPRNALIFPDQSPNQILNGYAKGSMPDEYTGGVGADGVANLRKFVEAGGTLVFLNRASNFAIEQFNLPVRDVTQGLNKKDFYIPGSILRTELDTTNPIARGMPEKSIAWFENSPAFEITDGANVKIIARYPPKTEDILLSGWALGAEKLAGKAALVEVKMGKGKIVLFGFRPQYRGQSLATFPLLFNAIAN